MESFSLALKAGNKLKAAAASVSSIYPLVDHSVYKLTLVDKWVIFAEPEIQKKCEKGLNIIPMFRNGDSKY